MGAAGPGGLTVLSGNPGCVGVYRDHLHVEGGPEQEVLGRNGDRLRPDPQFLGQQDDDVVGPGGVVAGQVFPLQVGVHGHLGASASAQGRHEVYGRPATATLDERYGSGEIMTMFIEWQAPRSGHWMRTPGVEMRPPAGGCRMSVEVDYRSAPC